MNPQPSIKNCVREVISKKAVFSFDGDDLRTDSFTIQMLAYAALELVDCSPPKEIYLWAFKYFDDVESFRTSWHNKIVRIDYEDPIKSILSDNCAIFGGVRNSTTILTLRVRISRIQPVHSCDHELYYPYLGLQALKTTKADSIITFGGGASSCAEFELCEQNITHPLRWYFYPTKRLLTVDGSTYEDSLLSSFAKESLPNGLILLDN